MDERIPHDVSRLFFFISIKFNLIFPKRERKCFFIIQTKKEILLQNGYGIEIRGGNLLSKTFFKNSNQRWILNKLNRVNML